jgi:hypothetical protein
MTLGAPAALWALLLIPLVVILYMLRARREPRIVPSVLLWERATRDLIARMPMRRLERSLLLLVQVLIIAVVVLALARPSLSLRGFAGDAVALVIDTSASMQATDVAPSRLAVAQAQALALAARLGPRQPAALIAAGPRPRLVVDLTTDRGALRSAIRSLRATDAGAALDDAVALAVSLRAAGRPAVVYLFSGRAPQQPGVRWMKVGAGAPNAGITSASARLDARGRAQLMLRVEAFGEPASRVLTVDVDGRAVARRDLWVAPGAPQVVLVDLGEATGLATARLSGRDALPADDRAVVAVGRAGLPRVLIVGDPDPVLDALLGAVPTAGVMRSPEAPPSEWGRAPVVVLDRVQPQTLPPGAYLLLGTLGVNMPVHIEGTVGQQVVRNVVGTHPVTRLVDLRGVRIAGALALRPEAGVVLAEGDAPVVWAYEGRGIRAVVLPFDLARTDLPTHPAFPVLMANIIDWLAGPSETAPGLAPVVPAGPWTRAELREPDGAVRTLQARDGVFALPALDRVGPYRLRTGGWERQWVVSTVDPAESSLAVGAAAPAQTAAAPVFAQVGLAPPLLAAAALLIALEWWLWTRTLPGRRGRRQPP